MSAAVLTELTPEMEAKVMGTSLELDGMAFAAQRCYMLPADRAERYGKVFAGLAPGNAVAVVGECAGEIMETVVRIDADDCEHCFLEDPIMMTEVPLPGLVEAQFEEGGVWVMGAGGMDSIMGEKAALWKVYEGMVTKVPPDCMSATRRMLQAGPVIRLFDRGSGEGGGGFTLRMPEEERADWLTENAKGEVARHLPFISNSALRPCLCPGNRLPMFRAWLTRCASGTRRVSPTMISMLL